MGQISAEISPNPGSLLSGNQQPAVKIAKDCGSAAVLIASLLCALVWTGTLLDRLLA